MTSSRSNRTNRRLVVLLLGALAAGACSSGRDDAAVPESGAVPQDSASTDSSVAASTRPEPSEPEPTPAPVPTVEAASSGCGQPPPAVTELELALDGERRTAQLHVPATYSADVPAPLLFDFHGHGGTARHAQRTHGLDSGADSLGAITVYPQGLMMADGKPGWHTGSPSRDLGAVDDVEFATALLDQLLGDLCIDEERVWATGHSNGGGMVALLACRASDRFRAFVAVAGAFYLAGDCPTAVPRPFLEIHGLADATVPYEGGVILPSIVDYLGEVAARAGCDPSPSVDGMISNWVGCAAPVAGVALPGQGHPYPADAARMAWEFFTTGAVTG